jgi:hypothetical protein
MNSTAHKIRGLHSCVSAQAVGLMTKMVNEVESRMISRWGKTSVDLVEMEPTLVSSSPTLIANPPNPGTAEEALETFLSGLIDQLVSEYDMSEDEAIDHVFSCADDLAEDGLLLPLPDEGDEDADSEWLAQASTVGFSAYVFECA